MINFLIIFLLFICSCEADQTKPFFSYSEIELENLRHLPISKKELNSESLAKWDALLYQLTNDDKSLDGSDRVMAYLYVAERDFALLSLQISQQWVGDFTPLLNKIVLLFYPKFHPQVSQADDYSEKLSDLVFQKIKSRYSSEESQLKEYPSPTGKDLWTETPPYFGRRIGSSIPWIIDLKNVKAPVPPGPGSIIWAYGVSQILSYQSHLTDEQIYLIKYWAGDLGPESGNWFAIMNHDLSKKQLAFPEFLWIRAIFAMAYQDAMMAVFDSKYTYWVRRPMMLSSKIKPFIPVPKHPSYPAGHSTISSTAATILSHFFPDEKEKWQNLAFQCGNTRIWAGLHFVYDHEQGLIQGEKVGNEIIGKMQ